MKWPTIQLDAERLRSTGAVFESEIEADDWVVYHGTSGQNADGIEARGLGHDGDSPVRAEVARIVSLFERIRWAGVDTGGFAVLASFSKYDLKDGATHPVFLAECSHRALLFASRDFAGGEKLRAIRRALDDLWRYLDDADVREDHMRRQKRAFADYAGMPRLPPEIETLRPAEVDLETLAHDLASLSSVRALAKGAFESFQHGVVYALRMTRDDLPRLRWSRSMGIEAAGPVPPERIIAKAVIPAGYEHDPFRRANFNWLKPSGLLAALLA